MSNQKTNKTLKKKSLTGHRTIKNNKQNLNNTTEEMEQFEEYKLEVIVIEALITNNLLQESN